MDRKPKNSTKSAKGESGIKRQITISKFFKKDVNVENQISKRSKNDDVDKSKVKKILKRPKFFFLITFRTEKT